MLPASLTFQISEQLRTLRPSVEAVRARRTAEAPVPLGATQLKATRAQLQHETQQIDSAVGRVDQLAVAVAAIAASEPSES